MPIRQHNGSLIANASTHRIYALLLVLPFLVTGYLLSAGDSGLSKLWEQSERIGVLEGDIARVERENKALAEEARLLKDDLKTIERIARERYGMVKENESVYMLYPHPPEKTR